MRIGIGYDTHKLVKDRKLILGGVNIPFERGLLGHSDADVLIHAIMDSLLGALALGDIGRHFPDSDKRYKDISSMALLEKVSDLLEEKGYRIENIDSVVVAQSPKLAPYIEDMRKNIGKVLEINLEQVNIKASTSEGLGFIGQGQGITCHSVALIKK